MRRRKPRCTDHSGFRKDRKNKEVHHSNIQSEVRSLFTHTPSVIKICRLKFSHFRSLSDEHRFIIKDGRSGRSSHYFDGKREVDRLKYKTRVN